MSPPGRGKSSKSKDFNIEEFNADLREFQEDMYEIIEANQTVQKEDKQTQTSHHITSNKNPFAPLHRFSGSMFSTSNSEYESSEGDSDGKGTVDSFYTKASNQSPPSPEPKVLVKTRDGKTMKEAFGVSAEKDQAEERVLQVMRNEKTIEEAFGDPATRDQREKEATQRRIDHLTKDSASFNWKMGKTQQNFKEIKEKFNAMVDTVEMLQENLKKFQSEVKCVDKLTQQEEKLTLLQKQADKIQETVEEQKQKVKFALGEHNLLDLTGEIRRLEDRNYYCQTKIDELLERVQVLENKNSEYEAQMEHHDEYYEEEQRTSENLNEDYQHYYEAEYHSREREVSSTNSSAHPIRLYDNHDNSRNTDDDTPNVTFYGEDSENGNSGDFLCFDNNNAFLVGRHVDDAIIFDVRDAFRQSPENQQN